jgi:hypothetical protein
MRIVTALLFSSIIVWAVNVFIDLASGMWRVDSRA